MTSNVTTGNKNANKHRSRDKTPLKPGGWRMNAVATPGGGMRHLDCTLTDQVVNTFLKTLLLLTE